jgi:hypothetical protein
MQMRRWIAVVVAALMMVSGALPGLADERVTDERASVEQTDRTLDRPSDRPIDRPVDRPADSPVDRPVDPPADGPTDRPADQVTDGPADRPVEEVRPTDRMMDRPVDREVDRRCVDFVTDRSCVDDRHPHVNIRHLIQRLIHAGEWEKLFRLLHRLGII